jgi:hypothetical protein
MSEEKAKSIAVAEADANEEEEALKPQTFRLSYEEMARTKRKPDDRAIIIAQPEEMGIDIDELGLPSRSTCASAVQNQSGLGAHTVKNAKEELSKLQGLTRSIS